MLNMDMKVNTTNEFGKLKSVIVGRADNGVWPREDHFFNAMTSLSTYKGELKRGPINEEVLREARDDLLAMRDVLEDFDVEVFRPEPVDWKIMTSTYYTTTGMHSYSARDLLLSVGDMVIECPTPYISRQQEFRAFDVIKQEAMRDGCRWISAPQARMETPEFPIVVGKIKLTERYPIFDAANVMKFGDKLLYLRSSTANLAGAKWLQSVVGTQFEVIVWEDVYAHAHIDSTVSSIAQDTVILNATRVNNDNLPEFMKGYKKIYVEDMAERTFHEFPYASKWIGMNVLSIDPETIMVDSLQKDFILQLNQAGFKTVPLALRHARTLGGGHHCVTCDLEREV